MFDESVSTTSIWASMNSWFTPTVFFVLLNVMIGTIVIASSLTNQKQQDQDEQQRPQPARSPSVLQRPRSINVNSHRSQEPASISRFEFAQNSDTHYPPHQSNLLQALESHTHYVFQHNHDQQVPETETPYVSQETHQERPQETDQERPQETEIQSHFDDIREPEKVTKEGQDFIEKTQEDDENEEVQSLDEVYSQLTENYVSRSKSDTKPTSGDKPVRLPAKIRKSASSKSVFGHFEEVDILEVRRPATMREGKARVTEEDAEVDAKADDFINRFKEQLKLQRRDSIIRKKEMVGGRSGNN